MSLDRYVAYVGAYTRKNSVGIHILDLDAQTMRFTDRKVVHASNPSYVMVSKNGKYLYSTEDQGVNAYRIAEDGDLEFINTGWNGGMRGCWLETDPDDRLLFVAGYFDGRISVMHLNEDGSVGDIADGVFHEGITVDEFGHDFMPHVTCVSLTPDGTGIFAVDNGLDRIMVYDFDKDTGKLRSKGVMRCGLDSGPRRIIVDRSGRFLYVLCERTNQVCVYGREELNVEGRTVPEPIQKISTVTTKTGRRPAAFGMDLMPDGKHLFVTSAVTNTAVVYDVDGETGMLSVNCSASLSAEMPRAVAGLPDSEHFAVLGANTGNLTVYKVNFGEKYFLMSAKPLLIGEPNSVCIHRLPSHVS